MSQPELPPPSEPVEEDFAPRIEYQLLRPELSESDVARGCEAAQSLGLGVVIARAPDVDLAVRWLSGSTALHASLDLPHGQLTTSAKTFAARDLLRRGVTGLHTVLNTGKLVSRQFQYLEMEMAQIAEACHQTGARLTVRLESEFLDDELRLAACRILKRAGAGAVATGLLTEVTSLREYARDRISIAGFDVGTEPECAREFWRAGCERIASENAPALLAALRRRNETHIPEAVTET